uniref:Bifunctional inhibitor/plant lipid transfer protein/seed storage helical domain-containing protein n=1 Tax=Ananas comosus var. bracteatus TaxID=296719 RepID=A0A6V7QFH9_ANACO|nr:unnamed protein product [Ananas comosus var. bracteatus]
MAPRAFAIGLALSLVAVLLTQSRAQPIPNCPPPSANSLSPCISYIIGNSSYPSSACCKQLKALAQEQGPCVCTVLRGGAAATPLGYIMNQTQAYLLPSSCNLPTLNQCNGVSGPSNAPGVPATPATTTATSPAAPLTPTDPNTSNPSTTSTPSTPGEDSSNVTPTPESSLPSGIGFKTTPTAGASSAAAGSTKLAPLLFFFAVFVASCGSTFSGF